MQATSSPALEIPPEILSSIVQLIVDEEGSGITELERWPADPSDEEEENMPIDERAIVRCPAAFINTRGEYSYGLGHNLSSSAVDMLAAEALTRVLLVLTKVLTKDTDTDNVSANYLTQSLPWRDPGPVVDHSLLRGLLDDLINPDAWIQCRREGSGRGFKACEPANDATV
ncbi:hypothetical protein EV122DRAFT_284586 [Schizophyllum commune]